MFETRDGGIFFVFDFFEKGSIFKLSLTKIPHWVLGPRPWPGPPGPWPGIFLELSLKMNDFSNKFEQGPVFLSFLKMSPRPVFKHVKYPFVSKLHYRARDADH